MLVRKLLDEDSEAAPHRHDAGGPHSRPGGVVPKSGRGARWSAGADVKHERTLLPLRSDGTLDLDEVQQWALDDSVDISVVVTEIPRTAARDPKTVELHFAERLAVISLPALGPVMVRRSLRRELGRAVSALAHDTAEQAEGADGAQELGEPDGQVGSGQGGPDDSSDEGSASAQDLMGRVRAGMGSRVENQEGHETVYISSPRWFPGRMWATLGMVAANEPMWSLPKLSAVFAAAAATGAFGIFFSTIWEMANVLPAWRLSVVSVIAVVVVVLWLILANRLWDRTGDVGGKREAFMYNSSTVVTLLISVSALYLLLFTGILVVASLLIDPGFMAQEIGQEADFGNYVDIAWLSASMGTVAGAIGSNFDDNADLENLTQGSREAKRYPRDEDQP